LRLGRDKALETFDIGNLTERVLSRLSLFNQDIILVCSAVQNFNSFVNDPRLRLVTDIYPEKGPLGGLYTGLSVSTTSYNILVACDMPFLNTEMLEYMASQISGFDAVVPRFDSYVEPLHAIYARSCIKQVKEMLDTGIIPLKQLCDRINVRYIEKQEINRFDPGYVSFFNINTESDLKKAREMMRKGKDAGSL
jgi:molybdenum cofactor guanylyltransferase